LRFPYTNMILCTPELEEERYRKLQKFDLICFPCYLYYVLCKMLLEETIIRLISNYKPSQYNTIQYIK
jgi:hypothetical protein